MHNLPRMRRALGILAALALVGVLIIGLTQAGSGDPADTASDFDLAAARERLRGAPAPLAALHEQSAELLEGDESVFKARLKELEGHPVVVNVWGSWCPPCRREFPLFQEVATELGREVAFLGIDTVDPRDNAERWLEQRPIPYPSYRDPRGSLARFVGGAGGAPITTFYDATGKRVFVKQGEYRRKADLLADIEEYAR